MANEIRIGLGVTGEQVAKQKLQVVEKQAEKTGDAIEDMGGQAVAAGKATGKVGDDFKGAADEAGHLQREVDELTESYKSLLAQFNDTGDQSLKKTIGQERRKLNASKRNLKDLLPEPAEAIDAGTSLGKRIAEGIGAGVGAGGPYVTAALAAAAALAVPGIAATVSGAILGGVGVGGIVGGVALAAQDPRVENAGEEIAALLGDQFTDAAEGFVDPVLRSLEKVGNAKWADKLAPSFDKLAGHVDPLTDGLLELVDNLIPGLNDAIEGAGPSLDVLADGLPEIGSALGDFFSTIAENPEAAAHALELLIDTITDIIDVSAFMISGLSESYEKAYSFAESIGVIEEETQTLGWRLGEGEDALDGFGSSAEDAAAEVAGLDKSIQKLIDDAFGLQEAQDDAASAFERLGEQIKRQHEENEKGAGSLRGNTQAARDNREAMVELDRIYGRLIIENVEAGKGIDGLREQFLKQARQIHLNSKEAERYADVLFKLPREIEIDIWLKTRGARAFNQILAGIGSVDGARASGGPVMAGGTYLVGESGPELLRMGGSGGYVHNAGQTASMMSGASGGSAVGGGALQVAVTVVGTDALSRAVAESLRFEIRTTANGDPVEYFS